MNWHAAMDVRKGYVRRLYTTGHEGNMAAWLEELEEDFAAIVSHFGDDPEACHVKGEPL